MTTLERRWILCGGLLGALLGDLLLVFFGYVSGGGLILAKPWAYKLLLGSAGCGLLVGGGLGYVYASLSPEKRRLFIIAGAAYAICYLPTLWVLECVMFVNAPRYDPVVVGARTLFPSLAGFAGVFLVISMMKSRRGR